MSCRVRQEKNKHKQRGDIVYKLKPNAKTISVIMFFFSPSVIVINTVKMIQILRPVSLSFSLRLFFYFLLSVNIQQIFLDIICINIYSLKKT